MSERKWPVYLAIAIFVFGFWLSVGMAVLFAFG